MHSSDHFGIFVERQVGIGSAAAALEPYLKHRPGVHWTDVTYVQAHGLVERLPLPKRAKGTLRGFLQTSRGLAEGPFAAQLFLTHNPAVFQPLALRRTPTALWTDVTPSLLDSQAEAYDHPVDHSGLARFAKRAIVKATFHAAARCVGWSDWARRSFVADYGVPAERTAVVPPGVDLERWRLPPAGEKKPRFLFVGGNFSRKGGDLLLEVFRTHLRGRVELDLITRDAVENEDGVSVHRGLEPNSQRLTDLYHSATAMVLPTLGDCFSIAALEAMAVGLPVVITKVGGIPEIVEHAQSGFLIEPRDGRALRESLEALLADPARANAMGRRGRELAEQRFSAKQSAQALFDLLGTLRRS